MNINLLQTPVDDLYMIDSDAVKQPLREPVREPLRQPQKIYCANCIHCKLLRSFTEDDKYLLRVRCDAGKWRKKLGDEKFYKYSTVTRRILDDCDQYSEMGESSPFMKQLRKTLPRKDEIYDIPVQPS